MARERDGRDGCLARLPEPVGALIGAGARMAELHQKVEGGVIILPALLTTINFFLDRRSQPTTTHETIASSKLIAEELMKTVTDEEMRLAYEQVYEYFDMANGLINNDVDPAEAYACLRFFFEEKGLFAPKEVSTEDYVRSCLEQAGIEGIDDGVVREFIKEYGEEFHHEYLARIFPPKAETMDLEPADFPEHLREIVAACLEAVFADYHDIKSKLIAIFHPNPEKRRPLLLEHYLGKIGKYVRWLEKHPSEWFDRKNRKPVIVIVGAGKGEELRYLTEMGYCVIVIDMQEEELLEGMIRETYETVCPKTGEMMPDIVRADEYDFERFVDKFAKRNGGGYDKERGAILIMRADLDNDEIAIPDGAVDVVANSYGLHHAKSVVKWIKKMLRIAHPLSEKRVNEKAVICVDGLPTIRHLLAQVLPIIAFAKKFTTGWDSVVSHARCFPPEIWNLIKKYISKDIDLRVSRVGGKDIETSLGTFLSLSQVALEACDI